MICPMRAKGDGVEEVNSSLTEVGGEGWLVGWDLNPTKPNIRNLENRY